MYFNIESYFNFQDFLIRIRMSATTTTIVISLYFPRND